MSLVLHYSSVQINNVHFRNMLSVKIFFAVITVVQFFLLPSLQIHVVSLLFLSSWFLWLAGVSCSLHYSSAQLSTLTAVICWRLLICLLGYWLRRTQESSQVLDVYCRLSLPRFTTCSEMLEITNMRFGMRASWGTDQLSLVLARCRCGAFAFAASHWLSPPRSATCSKRWQLLICVMGYTL